MAVIFLNEVECVGNKINCFVLANCPRRVIKTGLLSFCLDVRRTSQLAWKNFALVVIWDDWNLMRMQLALLDNRACQYDTLPSFTVQTIFTVFPGRWAFYWESSWWGGSANRPCLLERIQYIHTLSELGRGLRDLDFYPHHYSRPKVSNIRLSDNLVRNVCISKSVQWFPPSLYRPERLQRGQQLNKPFI